jgi:excinuclease ABC subunit C
MIDRADALDGPALLESFLSQHYLPRLELPRRIAAGDLPAGAAVLGAALARRAGHAVEVVVPRRGRERQLVAAAERNAAHALEDLEARRAGRRARFAPDVLELQKALDLAAPPHRVVCFDVSNFGAESAVAAVVASENGVARKGLYRRMRIRHPGPDDFAMIGEAVERYWIRVESGELPRPDLVMVDGGVGQLGAARAALDRVTTRPVALIGLAKREETVVRETAPALRLPRRSRALHTLQRLRDEAHRFGLGYHRLLRGGARTTSALDRVPGVGPARRAALLREFGSIAGLRAVAPEDIARRARVPLALAARIAVQLADPAEPAALSAPGPEPHRVRRPA